jgi:glycosyltransferase involved in cell wall biosynthesis
VRSKAGFQWSTESADLQTLPQLSVVIPVHNGGNQLLLCLQALLNSSFRDFELLVVDDCSTDTTPQIIQSYGVRYLRTTSKLGPAGARNLGASHAHGRILVFVDADVQVPPEALQIIVEDFNHDPFLAAVFGSYDQSPAEPGFFSQYKNLLHHYVHQRSSADAATFWAGCGAIRRKTFQELGGFDVEKYPRPTIEDIELGVRLKSHGLKVLLDKRLQVKHLKRWTMIAMVTSDIRDRAVPWSNLILETKEIPSQLNLTWEARLSAACTMLLATLLLLLLGSAQFGGVGVLLVACGAMVSALLLIALNRHVYRFFWKQRGFVFMMAALPTHWLYYFYSGVVWIYCFSTHYLRPIFTPPRIAHAGPVLDFKTDDYQDCTANHPAAEVHMATSDVHE